MLETTLQTELGQLLDTMCDNLTLADFSLDRWRAIVTYKTAFYSFYLSVAFAMTYAGIEEQGAHDPDQDGRLLPGAGRLPRLLRHARADWQDRHRHREQKVRLALLQRVQRADDAADQPAAEGAARRAVRQVQGR